MVYKVRPEEIIEKLADELKDREETQPPEWANYVKTGVGKERAPQQEDWWYTRGASIIRKIYMEGPVGVRSLAKQYGSRKNHGSAPHHRSTGSRKVIRVILQQLEDAELAETVKGGRRLTPQGRSLVDRLNNELAAE